MLLILIFAYSLFFLVRYDYHKNILRAIIDSSVIFCALTAVIAEFLSLFSAYRVLYLFFAWLVVSTVCVWVFRGSVIRSASCLYAACGRILPGKGADKIVGTKTDLSRRLEYTVLAAIAVFFLGTLATTFLNPYANYDSLVYHLPRVFYWFKNGSVHNFPASMGRQLYTGPFNAFIMLQTITLSHGNDWLIHLPQWFSYVGSVIASSLLAAELGLSRRWQILSALLAATIPLSILQAGTTQNDLMAAFWCAVSVYYVLRLINDREWEQWLDTGLFIGLSVGIAVLTKTSAVAALVSFAILAACLKLRKKHFIKFVYITGIILCCVMLISAGFYIRNAIDLNGDFLAVSAPEIAGLRVEVPSFNYRVAVMTQNLMYNFHSSSPALTAPVKQITNAICSLLGVDIYDERFYYHSYMESPSSSFSHDEAANPFHSLLVLFSIAIFTLFTLYYVKSKKRKDKTVSLQLAYMVACIASFCTVAASFLFVTGASRYLLAPLLLSMPFCAAVISSARLTRRIAGFTLTSAIFLSTGAIILGASVIMPFYAYVSDNAIPDREGLPPIVRIQKTLAAMPRLLPEAVSGSKNPDPFVVDIAKLTTKNNVTQIGVEIQRSIATYQILNLFWDKSFEVAQINALYHSSEEDSFVPQIILAAPRGNVSPVELNGITYVPVLSATDSPLVILIDEAFLVD